MPSRGERIRKSREEKNDEFYTLYDDIAAELPNYKEYLKGKRIICPCDWDESFEEEIVYSDGAESTPSDLFTSKENVKDINVPETKKKFEKDFDLIKCNFIKFLVSHAEAYGIKSISVSGFNPFLNKGIKFQEIDYTKYDVVITNPPFSLFREFVDVMIKNGKDFLIVGPQHGIMYKETFKYNIKNKIWIGYHYHLTGFLLPDGSILPKNDNLPRSCCWFTNLPVSIRNDELILTQNYDPVKNPKYDNFDAIEVGSTTNIPYDYDGIMGVPITFLQKFNPEQFEILGLGSGDSAKEVGVGKNYRGRTDLAYTRDGKHQCPFGRILIKNKKVRKDED